MKNFFFYYKNIIGVIIDAIIIILGLSIKNYVFVIMGIVLLLLTLYVAKLEKKDAEEKARIAAEKKKATPKESICIINLWYRSNEKRWLNKKRDIKIFDDVLIYEAESMTYSKGNLSIV